MNYELILLQALEAYLHGKGTLTLQNPESEFAVKAVLSNGALIGVALDGTILYFGLDGNYYVVTL